jgi:hypothetical protein
MTLIERPKDFAGIKAVEAELFMFEEYRLLTQEDFNCYKIIKEKDSYKLWISEHNMINNSEIIMHSLLISKSEMPLKGDDILVEQLDGNYLIEKAKKNLSNKDLYLESTRVVFKIICSTKDMNSEHLNNIITEKWSHGDNFHLECENRIYNKKNQKEVDYIFYESNNIIFKLKEPIKII